MIYRILGLTILAWVWGSANADAGWDVRVEEAAFGKTEARATSGLKGGSQFFFECVNDELAFGLIVISRNDDGQQSGMATLRVMVDDPPHEDFNVAIGSTIGGMLRLTSVDADDAEQLAFKIMAAKKGVHTGVLENDGGIWLATKRSPSGARSAISKVLKSCDIEMPEPPTVGSVIELKNSERMPWLSLCLYDKKAGVNCNCESIDQTSCRFTGLAKKSRR